METLLIIHTVWLVDNEIIQCSSIDLDDLLDLVCISSGELCIESDKCIPHCYKLLVPLSLGPNESEELYLLLSLRLLLLILQHIRTLSVNLLIFLPYLLLLLYKHPLFLLIKYCFNTWSPL